MRAVCTGWKDDKEWLEFVDHTEYAFFRQMTAQFKLVKLTYESCVFFKNLFVGLAATAPGGALGYLGGRIRSLSKLKNTPKALISGQKSTLILIKTLTFSTK